ncbi:AAA family ATPase [Cyanobium sp. FGCU-6]|nr:AAA family ATPase [Cyanobium sp. FGCU6]
MSKIPGYNFGRILQEGQYYSVYNALRQSDASPCLIKTIADEYPTRRRLALLRREYQLLNRLKSARNIVKPIGLENYGNGNIALVLEDAGEPLDLRLRSVPNSRMSISEVIRLAEAIALGLNDIHAQEIIHNNISPHCIFNDSEGTAKIGNLELHSELPYEHSLQVPVREIAGLLPYISPEQTGRINRNVDYRTDFYSLGITLYLLLTGESPFHADSPLEWVHQHISRIPRSPRDLDPSIPTVASEIVMKLIAKDADDRYQSSHALISDLKLCRTAITSRSSTLEIRLGAKDVSTKFQIPQQLVGREHELRVIRSVFENVASGATEFCMVTGYSGIGKSALVNELCKPLFLHRGFLLRGKYDQFQRSTPFSGLALALKSLIPQLLEVEEEFLDSLIADLRRTVHPNEAVLTEFIPDLESLLGVGGNLPELPRNEAQNRFFLTLLQMLKVVAATRPLVIFLDDLQFADSATLGFLNWLSAARDLPRMLLIGAYRSNEVDPGHPLQVVLNEISANLSIRTIHLGPLECSSVNQLVARTLHTPSEPCKELAELIHAKSQGNPFSIQEILRTMHRLRVIQFLHKHGQWRWNLEAARAIPLTDNIIDLVVSNMRLLRPEIQSILQRAACIGNEFDLVTLSQIVEQGMEATNTVLLVAMKQQIVMPMNNDYKLFSHSRGSDSGLDRLVNARENPTYRFLHDKLQQAAYELSDYQEREAIHYSVGCLLRKHASAEELVDNPIRFVDHLNMGRQLITDYDDKIDLAEHNLAAGMQAQRSAAYESALQYFMTGIQLGSVEIWQTNYSLALSLATEYQQCAYLTARYEDADHWFEILLKRSRTDLQRAEVLSMRTRQHSTTGKMELSIKTAIHGLALLGVTITQDPDAQSIANEHAAIKRQLRKRNVSDLIDSPAITNKEKSVAIRLLMEIFPAAFLSGSGSLFPYIVLKAVSLSLRYGNSKDTAFTYAAYGMLLCGSLGNPALGLEFGRLAIQMNDRFDDITLKSRVIYVYAMFVHHWSHSWASMTEWFRRGIEAGYQSGDLLYLAYSAQDCVIWDPTLDLETAERKHLEYLNIVRDCKYQDSLDSGTLFLQLQRNMLGRTAGLLSLDDDHFDEDLCLAGMIQRRFMTGVANYHIYKAEICYLYREHSQALVHVRAQDELLASAMSLPQLVRFQLISFLVLAASFHGLHESEQEEVAIRLRRQLKQMARWARHCPGNFLHLKLMMEGELARIQNQPVAALNRLKQSMAAAHASRFIRDEAFAHELAGRHLIAWDRPKDAEGYLRAAHGLFSSWCAHRKVRHLEAEFPFLVFRAPSAHPLQHPDSETASHVPEAAHQSDTLDMDSVIKASQTISSEIQLEQLLPRTIRILLENAGCQLGCFVLMQEGQLVEAARLDINQDDGIAPSSEPRLLDPDTLPLQVIQQVLRSGVLFVLNNAPDDPVPYADHYLRKIRPRSVLCLPMTRQSSLGGVIYMENRAVSGVITPNRIEVIRLLAAQASISIENARLYHDQQRLIRAQKRFVPSQFLNSLEHTDIASLELGENVTKSMSVIFADLRSFAPLAESLGASATIALLNNFFGCMDKPISSCGGFIDSYSGDQIMALFDVSTDCAVKAGLEMFHALGELNDELRCSSRPTLRMGIGLNTGPLVLGTVGGGQRIQCSVIGDTVNTASRLEELTKVYGARFLMSEESHTRLISPELVQVRRVDQAIVRGRNQRVNVYEVLDADPPHRRDKKLATHDILQAGIDAFLAGEIQESQMLFDQVRDTDPEDRVPLVFLERFRRQPASGPQPKQGDKSSPPR